MSLTFSDLGISSIIDKSLNDLNIISPTEIQEKTIPVLLNQSDDFVGLAKTGTGKTAAFGLPLLQLVDVTKNKIQAIVLVPTRELGQQIISNLASYSTYFNEIKIVSICGGTPIKPQIEILKEPTHIIVATPGRLIDLIQREEINLSSTNYLVLDEADEMVTSLKDGLDKIVAVLPKKRRTFLFSATLPGTIKQLIQNYMSKHITQVSVDMTVTGNKGIDHKFIVVKPIEKLEVLMHFLASKEGERGIIFCKTKAAVNKLAKNLAINRFSSGAIHGSLSQGVRDRIMGQFRDGHINTLIATDLAARGIDVKEISYVVNYHLPDTFETYVHRSGRTARAGAKGVSLSVIQDDELDHIPDFEEALGLHFDEIQKPDALSIEENNTLLWAKKIFKTKPNREVSSDLKNKINTIFHHLTKEELVDKILASYINKQEKPLQDSDVVKPKKKKRNSN